MGDMNSPTILAIYGSLSEKRKRMKRKKSNKDKGNAFEEKVKNTINSGALVFDKGDLKTCDLVIECKFTEAKGFRISTKILNKIWSEALDSNKLPRLVVGIKDGEELWTIVCDITKGRI